MKKFFRYLKLLWIIKRGKPYIFHFVSDSEGEPVGPELKVGHLTFHDMAAYACRCKLTEEVILHKLPANAIRIIDFERTDGTNGITTFQPCKV